MELDAELMSVTYLVTPEVLSHFQEPFGILIQGTYAKTMQKFKALLESEKPPMVISVGDTVTRNLAKYNVQTHMSITDNKSHRRKIHPQTFPDKCLVRVRNPPGTITPLAIAAIKEGLANERPVHLLVEGEEDLLTIVAVLEAPENALVVYGQPHKGIVVVKATPRKKREAEKILKRMKTIEKEQSS